MFYIIWNIFLAEGVSGTSLWVLQLCCVFCFQTSSSPLPYICLLTPSVSDMLSICICSALSAPTEERNIWEGGLLLLLISNCPVPCGRYSNICWMNKKLWIVLSWLFYAKKGTKIERKYFFRLLQFPWTE